jgi:hypothetical protein
MQLLRSQPLMAVFFLLVVLDGAIRKWALPGHAEAVYFTKDALLMAAFVKAFLQGTLRWPLLFRRTWVALVLVAYAAWVFVEAVNPELPALTVGLFGLRSHVLYLLLVPLLPAVLSPSADRRLALVRRYVWWIALPIAALGVAQFSNAFGSVLNKYVSVETVGGIATFGLGGRVRITGTFSYISGMTTFCILNLSLAIGLLVSAVTSPGRRWVAGVVLMLVYAVVGPMTGSRSVLAMPLAGLPFVVAELARRRGINSRLVTGVVLAGFAGLIIMQTSAAAGWTAFIERVTTTSDASSRVGLMFSGPIRHLELAGPFGYGAGSTHQAAPRLVPGTAPYSWLPTQQFEDELGRVALELGAVGFVLFLALKIGAVLLAIRAMRRARDPASLTIAVTAVIFCSSHFAGNIVFNVVGAVFFWGLLAVSLEPPAVLDDAVRARGPHDDQRTHGALRLR